MEMAGARGLLTREQPARLGRSGKGRCTYPVGWYLSTNARGTSIRERLEADGVFADEDSKIRFVLRRSELHLNSLCSPFPSSICSPYAMKPRMR